MPVAITSWDVRVVSAMDVNTVISYVPRWTSIEFSDQLNDVGSGKITHDFKDPFFAEFESANGKSLLTGPYALQILRNSTLVFSFFVEDVQVDRLAGSETVTISGRGIGAALEWAVVLPEGLSGTTRVGATTSRDASFFDRKFPGYAWNVRCATTAALTASYTNGNYSAAHPGVGAQLQATSSGNINSLGIDGIQDLVIGDTILVKNQANQAHNGIYWVLQTGSPSTVFVLQRWTTCDGSPLSDLDVGSAVFVQEGATNGYSVFSLSSNGSMTNPNQVGTNNLVFSPLTTGSYTALSAFWLLWKEADNGYEYSSVASEFGTEIQESGRGGPDFAVSWPLYLDSVIDANIGQLDSKGSVVQDGGDFTVPAGKTMLEVIKQVTDQTGLSWHFSPSGSVSFAVTPFTRNGVVRSVPYGTDRTSGSAAMLFTLPSLTTSDTKTSSTDRRTIVWGSDGRTLDRLESTNKSIFGIRESYFENTSSDAAAVANFTGSAMRKVDGGKISQTIKFVEQQGQTAWIDFSVGDKVLVESAIGVFSEQIVSALSATVSASDEHNIEITLGEVFPDIASDLEAQAGFGSLNAATLASFSGTPPNISLPAPTPRTAVASTAGMSNRVTVTWDNPNSGRVSKYEVAVYRQGTTKVPTSVVRRGNIVSATFSSAHALTNGMYVNITSDEGFGGFNIPLLNTSSSVIYYANSGPDYTATTSVGVAQVLEYTVVDVDGTKDTATIENLGAPGQTYSYHVTPYNEYGLAGEISTAQTFASSNEPFQLVGSAVQSASYSAGSSGWKISANGAAEFNSITLPSSSAALDIGGDDSTSFHVDATGNMWLGASIANKATAPFRVTNAGYLTATTGAFSGQLDVGSGNTSFHVDTAGNMWLGNASYASAPFKVSNTGSVTATTGTFSGTINGGTIDIGGLDTTSFHVDSSGNMWVGASTYAAAPFKISAAGFVTSANGATFTGGLSSTSDASFAGGDGYQSYVQNDGRFQSIYAGTVYAQMGTNGISLADGVQFGSFTSSGSAYLRGIGIRYSDATFGPGYNNAIAFNWNGSDPFIIVDNVLGVYITGAGVTSDRRIKVNIAEPSNDWIDKLLNQVKIYQFDKVNPLNQEDLHVYKGHIGVMADEFKEIFPQFESSSLLLDPDGADADKIRSVDYSFMIPGLLLIAQKFDSRLKEIEARLGI
jgi:hypothetical protein